MPLNDPVFQALATEPWRLFDLLGSFWREQLTDSELVRYMEWSRLCGWADAQNSLQSYTDGVSVQVVPLSTTHQWIPVVLLESQLTLAPNQYRYGDALQYGDGHVYGQVRPGSYAWPMPSWMRGIGFLVDRILEPSMVWGPGNMTFSAGTLRLTRNPFDSLASSPVYGADGTIVDRKIVLWARGVNIDQQDVDLRYGSLIGLRGQVSTEGYRTTVQRTWEGLIQGGSALTMWRGILGAAGLVAPAAGEVVTQLAHDSLYQYVITDVSVYRGHPAAVPLVSVGQTLGAMTALFDTVQMAELGSGAQGSDAVLPALVADQRLLDTGSPLVFPNQDETWEFVDLDGVPAARFTLLGDAAEIERYWGTLVSTGVRRDIALAQTVGVVGPGSAVPVNPMRFLLGITGANTVAIRLKPEHFLSADQRFLDRVTSLVSPATQLLFQTDVAPAQDALDLGSTSQDAADVYDALAAPLDQVTVGGSPLAHLVLSDLTPLITVT